MNFVDLKGECVGVRLTQRNTDDPHIMFTLLVEDDGNWFPLSSDDPLEGGSRYGGDFSSHWIDETLDMLKAAKAVMQTQEKDGDGS